MEEVDKFNEPSPRNRKVKFVSQHRNKIAYINRELDFLSSHLKFSFPLIRSIPDPKFPRRERRRRDD